MGNLVISILGNKGGIGKSTLATNLLRRVIDDEKSAILIDCDNDQHSSGKLTARREANKVKPSLAILNCKMSELEDKIQTLSKQYKVIFVEFGKATGDMEEEERIKAIRLATKIADKILMPLQPTQFDTETIVDIEEVFSNLKVKVPVFIVPNRVMSKEQLKELVDSEPYMNYFRVSKSYMENRLCYQRVHTEGKTIFDIKPKNDSEKNAIKESEQIFQEIFYDK